MTDTLATNGRDPGIGYPRSRPYVDSLVDGERWAREVLAELRDASWTPRGWVRFLRGSLQRSRQTADERPALAAQARRWSVVGVGGSVAASWLLRTLGLPRPHPSVSAAWASAAGTMLYWHIGMVEGPSGEARDALSHADAMTYARVLTAPAMLASSPDRRLFLLLLAAGALSDALDGPVARRCGPTRLGRDLDSAADVSFLLTAGLTAAKAGWLGRGAAAPMVVREPALVGASALFYFARAAPPPAKAVGATRFAGPLLTLGLALTAIGRRKPGSVVVVATTCAAAARHLQVLCAAYIRSAPARTDSPQ